MIYAIHEYDIHDAHVIDTLHPVLHSYVSYNLSITDAAVMALVCDIIYVIHQYAIHLSHNTHTQSRIAHARVRS